MADTKESRREYYIPDNFIEEGRILQGKIKVRNLAEAVIMAVMAAFPAMVVITNIAMSAQVKISVFIFFCAPPAILGIIGFNGDSVFELIGAAWKWVKYRQPMLYNEELQVLTMDPIDKLAAEYAKVNPLVDKYETGIQTRLEKKSSLNYLTDKELDFEKDESMEKYTSGKPMAKPKRYVETEYSGEELYGEGEKLY